MENLGSRFERTKIFPVEKEEKRKKKKKEKNRWTEKREPQQMRRDTVNVLPGITGGGTVAKRLIDYEEFTKRSDTLAHVKTENYTRRKRERSRFRCSRPVEKSRQRDSRLYRFEGKRYEWIDRQITFVPYPFSKETR